MDGELIELVIQLGLVLLALGFAAWQTYRLRRAATEDIASDQCVACDSRALATIAPGVYRCTQCGYQGGPGLAAHEANARAQERAALSPDERSARARACLYEALGALQRADENPLEANVEARISWLADLEGALVQAQGQLTRAIEYAGGPVALPDGRSFDASPWRDQLASATATMTVESINPNLRTAMRPRLNLAKQLRGRVRDALVDALHPPQAPSRSSGLSRDGARL
ncbi:MAG: hypothetical protein H6713_32925 [Myxococcales bacterium]|nr:hypothetical protein [Myxococcales bacterium]